MAVLVGVLASPNPNFCHASSVRLSPNQSSTIVPIDGGLDLSSRIDLSAFVLYFPPVQTESEGGKRPAHVLSYFWCPEDTIRERSEKDKVPYEVWRRQGYLEATPGNVIDYAWIRRRMNNLAKLFKIKEVGYDPWGASQLTLELQDDGFNMVEVRQGFQSLSSPTKELFALVKSSCILHDGNPVLSWNMSNVAIRKDPAGNEKPDKEKAREKIDGAVALDIALSRAMLQKNHRSVYETRGVRVI
jgi:phage terminase large subunit-like protein